MFDVEKSGSLSELQNGRSSKEETLQLIDAGYSKPEIDRICRERDQPPPRHENQDLYGSWRGFCSYGRQSQRPDVPFHLMVTRQDRDQFSGAIKEPQTLQRNVGYETCNLVFLALLGGP